jgi:hypothetical protein
VRIFPHSPHHRDGVRTLSPALLLGICSKSTANHATGSSSSSATRNRQPSHTGRRRSTVLMNLQLNDPALPPPGEMINEGAAYRATSPQSMAGSPIIGSVDLHHYRTPSLGEIHQELEQEQEAQVVCQLFLSTARMFIFVNFKSDKIHIWSKAL